MSLPQAPLSGALATYAQRDALAALLLRPSFAMGMVQAFEKLVRP